MGQLIMAMLLLPLLAQAPSPSQTTSQGSSGAVQRQAEQPGAQSQGQAQPSNANPNPNPSPEFEKAIEKQVEQISQDEAIRKAIAEKIQQATLPGHPEMLIGLLVPISFFAAIALIAWLLYRLNQARMQARMEFHTQVLAKFASGQEFAEFLNSKGSRQLLEGLWSRQLSPKERILKRVRGGVVFAVLGLAFTLSMPWIEDKEFLIIAVLFLALGIGFLISAVVTYRLSKKLGLLGDKDTTSETGPVVQS